MAPLSAARRSSAAVMRFQSTYCMTSPLPLLTSRVQSNGTCNFHGSMVHSMRMSRHNISQAIWLRSRPFSLLDGVTSVFDWRPLTHEYNISPTPQNADARLIASDFYAVGDNMRAALSEYAPNPIDCRQAGAQAITSSSRRSSTRDCSRVRKISKPTSACSTALPTGS